MIRILTVAAAALLFFNANARGEDGTIAVRTLALRADEMPELFLHTGKEYLPLRFSAVQPTETLQVLAANPLPLYRSGTDANGKAGFIIAHRVKLPDRAAGILLLGWKQGEEPRFVPVKDEFAKAGYNDWLLINASQHPVAFKAGETATPLLLKPGVSVTHRIGAEKGEGIAVTAQAPLKGKVKTFFSTFWPVYADKRSLVVFVDDGTRILVKRISDSLAAPDPAKKPG
jgi:hypothetical protein